MMRRITISLTNREQENLVLLAERELRGSREQAAWIIRLELERQGFLEPASVKKDDSNGNGKRAVY